MLQIIILIIAVATAQRKMLLEIIFFKITTFLSSAASFPYFHMSNMEVIEEVKKGYRMPNPADCPEEV